MELYIDSIEDTGFDEKFIESVIVEISEFVEFNTDSEISVVFTNDEEICAVNAEYRNIDKSTDVLSFPFDDESVLGDVMISIDTAKRQAEERDIPLSREVAFLFIHGFLHLLGYDHETGVEDEKEMFALQEDILRSWVNKHEPK